MQLALPPQHGPALPLARSECAYRAVQHSSNRAAVTQQALLPPSCLCRRVDLEVAKRTGTEKQKWLVSRVEPVRGAQRAASV